MSVTYRIISRKNLQDTAAAPKFYALAVSSGKTDLDKLAALISDGSTVRQADVYAVLIGMVNAISKELAEGRIVQLGKLGSFSIGVRSAGAENEEEANSSLIKGAKLNYRPSAELSNMLKTLSYKKVG